MTARKPAPLMLSRRVPGGMRYQHPDSQPPRNEWHRRGWLGACARDMRKKYSMLGAKHAHERMPLHGHDHE